jgi:UDP-N-acetylglucosamine 4,6-dehydratase/5-epimerase
MLSGNIFITGGSGFLGRSIVRQAQVENWPCHFTVYSRGPMKQAVMRREFPNVRYVLGDVADYDSLRKSMIGHDIVIHAAAFKHIPEMEWNVLSGMESNWAGSINVAVAAEYNGVKQVVGISTDKACHPVNAYGASKMLLERVFQEFNRNGLVSFHLTRYGNVLSSTGSFLPDWKRKRETQGYIDATDPDMTRFWLSGETAVELIVLALSEPSGTITIPMLPSLSMRRMEEYAMPPNTEYRYTGLRPGEKRHEELLTVEESPFVELNFKRNYMRLHPVWSEPVKEQGKHSYSSDIARELSLDEFKRIIGEA